MSETEQTTLEGQTQVGSIVERVYMAFTLLGGVVALVVVLRALLDGRLPGNATATPDDKPGA